MGLYYYTALGNITNLGSGLTVCQIVSNVYISYPNIFAVAACSCCTPNIIPFGQILEFTKNNIPGIGSIYTMPTLAPDQTFFPTATQLPRGNYKVRYRNLGPNCCLGPWLSPSQQITW